MRGDHAEIESLLERVIAAFESGDRSAVSAAWMRLEGRLLAHFDAEEQHLIPMLLRAHPRAATAVLADHRHLRARLAELGAGVNLRVVNVRTARAFFDELRAHAAHEERALYRWADEHAPDSVRASLLQAVEVPRIDSSADSSASTCTGLVK